MTVLSDEMGWRQHAACRDEDPRVFFPDRAPTGRPRSDGLGPDVYREARKVCRPCDVKTSCLKSVIDLPQTQDDSGMFGGYSPMERRLIRRCHLGECEHQRHQRRRQ